MVSHFRIGQGIAGADDTEHGQLRNSGGYREQLSVVLTIAVVALNIARRRDRDMDASVMLMSFFAIAGMSPNFVPDSGRQIAWDSL
ncbi:hypothetical protein IVB38_17780 [Bradyrhizobium sp. 38]|nr:hypothetical protein [Bradyrhizobium sp. 38]MCK1777235.1 hypothetical protein [Bradyrhizobium sp. 132]